MPSSVPKSSKDNSRGGYEIPGIQETWYDVSGVYDVTARMKDRVRETPRRCLHVTDAATLAGFKSEGTTPSSK